MPNVAALPNTGGALGESSLIPFLVPRRKVAHVHCSSANIEQGKTVQCTTLVKSCQGGAGRWACDGIMEHPTLLIPEAANMKPAPCGK